MSEIVHHDDVPSVCFHVEALQGLSDEYLDNMTEVDKVAWMFAMWKTPLLIATVEELVDGEWDRLAGLAGE